MALVQGQAIAVCRNRMMRAARDIPAPLFSLSRDFDIPRVVRARGEGAIMDDDDDNPFYSLYQSHLVRVKWPGALEGSAR